MDVELKRILSILRNKGSLTNGVPTSETFVNTTDSAEAISDNVGQQSVAATNDDMSDITTTPAMAKLRLILNRLSSDAFTATIQGAARTEVDTMLAQIATYLSAAGAAWSVQINNNLARTNLEQVIEDLSVVLGCDNANIFNPSIGGATRTDMDAAFAAVGTALGAEYDGTPDLYDVTVTGHDSTAIAANEDGSIDERLEQIQEAVNRGAGTSIAAGKSLVDALGSDGTTVTDSAVSVLGAVGANNNNNVFSSSSVVANADGSVLERLESLLLRSSRAETLPTFTEFWVAESGIQTEFWTTAVTATGTAARDMTETGYAKVLLNCPAAADTSNLYSVQRWRCGTTNFGTSTIAKKFRLQFEAKAGTLANIDNATAMLGLSNAQGDTRATNNIMAFVFVADALTSLTDSAGVETTNNVSGGITVTNWNKYEIEVYNGNVRFYINETLVATHAANLNEAMKYINFYADAEDATGATALHIGSLRAWYEDE